jgi:nucleoside-diphosphate-sugar epimerase
VRDYLPEARITFHPDPTITEIVRTTPKRMSGERAEREWGWNVLYTLDDTVKDFTAEVRNKKSEGENHRQ